MCVGECVCGRVCVGRGEGGMLVEMDTYTHDDSTSGHKERTVFPGSSCVRAAASSVAVTNPVLPRSLLLSNSSSVFSRGVGGRAI